MRQTLQIRLIFVFALGACLFHLEQFFKASLPVDSHSSMAQVRLRLQEQNAVNIMEQGRPVVVENSAITKVLNETARTSEPGALKVDELPYKVGTLNVNETAKIESPTLGVVPRPEAEDELSNFTPPADCGVNFKTSRQVFLDDACYPRTFSSTPKSPRKVDQSKRTHGIEIFKTQTWTSRYNYEFEEFRAEPAVRKTFYNALVYRPAETTLVKSNQVWTASMRCLLSNTTPKPPPEGDFPLIDEAVLSASQIWGEGYYHMLVEKAFMLAAARDVIEGNPSAKIIFERNYFQLTDFLGLIGIKPSQILIVGPPVKVKRLHMTYYSTCGYDSAENTQLMRKWIRDKNPDVYKRDRASCRDIVILDRSESGCKRCLLNTKDVVTQVRLAFPDRQVVHMVAGRMSVRDQMKTVANAEIFFAPHGSGLTNLIFLPLHGKVLEVENHPNYFHWGYYELALGLDLFYRAISPMRVSDTAVDFSRVDPRKVVDTMKELLALDPSSNSSTTTRKINATLSPLQDVLV